MAETLHLKPDEEPEQEFVQVGDKTLQLDSETARVIRESYENLAAQYGAALENFQRQAMQTVGTPQPMPQWQPPQLPEMVDVPDPDILFQNKQAWTQQFANSLEGRLAGLEGRQTQVAQGLANAFQQELARRDAAAEARARHDAAMQEMLERRGLTENTLVVQAVYNEMFDKLKHLPLEMGLDRIGEQAQREIEKIRSGEQWQLTPAQTQTGVAPRPPAMLRSARRSSRPAPTAAPEPQGLPNPGGELGMMGQIIRKRQEALLGRRTA